MSATSDRIEHYATSSVSCKVRRPLSDNLADHEVAADAVDVGLAAVAGSCRMIVGQAIRMIACTTPGTFTVQGLCG